MKKLTLSVLIASAMSLPAMAGHHEANFSTDFSALDADGNGTINTHEVNNSDAKDVLVKMDKNGNDLITRSEFNAYVDAHPNKFSGEVVMSVRAEGTNDAVLVKHGNAKVDINMLKSDMQNVKHDDMEGHVESMTIIEFDKIDQDQNGELTLYEVNKVDIHGSFDDLDMDNDDLVTRVEYNEYLLLTDKE